MAKKASKRAWTPEHVRTLKTLAQKKTRAASIAKTLKRTEGATRQKAFSSDCHSTFGPETSHQQAPGYVTAARAMARGFLPAVR